MATSPSLRWEAPPKRALRDDELPAKLQALIDPALQKYIDIPPGKGMGVIYVQIDPAGTMYVGQHNHARSGRSFRSARMDKVKKKGCRSIQRAFETFGHDCIRSFIISHASEGTKTSLIEGDTNDLEMFFISPAGLDTMTPKGHNLVEGGLNGTVSDSAREAMSESHKKRWVAVHADPVATAAASQAVKKARAELLADAERASQWKGRLSDSTKAYMNKVADDPKLKDEWARKHQAGQDQFNSDPIRRTAKVEKAKKTRASSQLLKDAQKWIPLLAKCDNDSQCRALLAKYDKVLRSRKKLNDSVERRRQSGIVRKDKRVRRRVV